MSEITFLSAAAMAQQIREKTFSSRELVDAHLDRIAEINPKLNSFVEVDEERARSQARERDEVLCCNGATGPLHGVPISIKSSIEVAGFRWEAGTNLRKGVVASVDAPLVSRLRDAGAVILGTTNTPELLMAGYLFSCG